MKSISISFLLLFICGQLLAQDQDPQFPIVKGFGGIYEMENTVERIEEGKKIKVLIELVSENENPQEHSFWVNNIARLMNLHGIDGVSKENLEVKVVVHGPALNDILSDGNYFEKFRIPNNPNIKVFEALTEAGAELIVCGQSLLLRDLGRDEIWDQFQVATSALTTITKNVSDGYVLIRF